MEPFSKGGSYEYGLLTKQPINCESGLVLFTLSFLFLFFSYYLLKAFVVIFFLLCTCCFSLGQVDSIPNPTKEQLIDVAQRHFMLLVLSHTHESIRSLLILYFNNCMVDSPFCVKSNCLCARSNWMSCRSW